ncbi:MAG TPA: helix-turn-helix domain-containing protein [Rhodanobacteraceae bacterium]
MPTLRTVWIDLCRVASVPGLYQDAQRCCSALRVTAPEAISPAIRGHRAECICVEYDYPDRTRLRLLSLLRREFPTLPLLMLTEFHSEALAIWAFRSRVWDYRVKPLDAATLAGLFDAMARAEPATSAHGWIAQALPNALVAPAGHLRRPLVAYPRTATALAWISEHYAESCRAGTLAGLCHLSESEFSRAFHREQGVSFRRFLMQFRIARARDLLVEPGVSVSEIAYGVGFNDLSQFGRMFRRVVGIPASDYQRTVRAIRAAPEK